MLPEKKCTLGMTAFKHVIFASYGNDSIALIQWASERKLEAVAVCYSDTGWASEDWEKRVTNGEVFCRALGFKPFRIPSMGMLNLVDKKKGWPRNGMQFCTQLLKIEPAKQWLAANEPSANAICLVGIRREESASRSNWPEWTEQSENHGGRSLWAPLVTTKEVERNELIRRAGFEVLPHRSMECFPCVNANKSDLKLLDETRIALIEGKENRMGNTGNGKPRVMFRPNKHMNAVGIRKVIEWANSAHGKFDASHSECDSGFCGD